VIKMYVMNSGYVWKLSVEMIVIAAVHIESKWMITLSCISCLDIQISAALTTFSSANVIGMWLGILPLIFFSVYLIKHIHTVAPFGWELASV